VTTVCCMVRALPDETLYSLVARYHALMGFSSYRDSVSDLFGTDFVSARTELPSRLAVLADRLGWRILVDRAVGRAAHGSSLLPIVRGHAAAATPYWLAVTACPPPSPAAVIGAMAGRVQYCRYLMYCADCVEEDLRLYAAAYWHRAHQLPGVVMCWTTPGSSAGVSLWFAKRVGRAMPSSTSRPSCLTGVACQRSRRVGRQRIGCLAEDSTELLEGRLATLDPTCVRAAIHARYRLIGWVGRGGSLRMHTIISAWDKAYPMAFRRELRCGIAELDQPETMVRSFINGGRSTVHPLVGLLLIRLAGASPSSIADDGRLPGSRCASA
jgi:hypothetical protein